MKRILLICAGLISLALGTAGIILPLLPTTPFLLLSSACFIRSSDSLYRWLINHRVFGDYIYAYQHFKAISLKTKVFTIVLLWLSISSSALFVVEIMFVRVLLFFIAVGVTVHILLMKTLSSEMYEEMKKRKVSTNNQ